MAMTNVDSYGKDFSRHDFIWHDIVGRALVGIFQR